MIYLPNKIFGTLYFIALLFLAGCFGNNNHENNPTGGIFPKASGVPAPQAATYTVRFKGDGNELFSNSSVSVTPGQSTSVVVTAATGYFVSQSVSGNCPIGKWNGSTYTTGAISNNCTVTLSANIDLPLNAPAAQSALVYANGNGFFPPIQSIALDGSGNLYSVAFVGNTWQLTKYDTDQNVLWVQSLCAASAMVLDANGNVFVAGTLAGNTCNFGNGVAVTGISGAQNLFLAKYSTNGVAQWANTFVSIQGASGQNIGGNFNSLAVDSTGNPYVGGLVLSSGTYDFGNEITISLSGSGTSYPVLVKYDALGQTQWAATGPLNTSTYSNNSYNSIAIDTNGNLYGLTAVGVEKFSSSGIDEGTLPLNSQINFSNNATIGIDSSGYIYIAGISTVVYEALFLKYDPSQQKVLWLVNIPHTGVTSMAFDNSGNIYLAGNFVAPSIDFGNGISVAGSDTREQAVLVAYNSSGLAQWAMTETPNPGNALAAFMSLAMNGSGDIFVAGGVTQNASANFGNGVTASCGNSNLTYGLCNTIIKYH